MKSVNIHEAKTHLSRLVGGGEGRALHPSPRRENPSSRSCPFEPPEARKVQRIGFMKGQIKVPDNFDRAFEDEIADEFEGKV